MRIHGNSANEKRRDKRLTGRPLDIEFDGQRFTAAEWSMGGFLIDTYDGDLEANTPLAATMHIGADDVAVARTVQIAVTRVDATEHLLAARFVDLDGDAYSLLERWASGRAPRRAG